MIYNAVLVSGEHKVIQLYIHIYSFLFRFFSHIGYYRILSRVPSIFIFNKNIHKLQNSTSNLKKWFILYSNEYFELLFFYYSNPWVMVLCSTVEFWVNTEDSGKRL